MTHPDLLGYITPAPRPPRSKLPIALTAVAAVAVAGAGVAVATVLGSGGAQPEDVLPRGTVGMVKVDLDPAADQKVAAFRLSRKFPGLKTSGQDSVMSDLLRQSVESSDQVDYAKDVEPWLGKRIGIAAVPAGTSVTPVVAVQITDRAKAEAGLKKLVADSTDPIGYALVDGEDYALITDSTQHAKEFAGATDHLSDNSRYGDAVGRLDGNQIVTAWLDVAAAYKIAPKHLRASAQQPSGFVVAGLHLDASYAELEGKVLDVQTGNASTTGRGKVGLVQKLPDDTIGAFGVTGLDEGLRTALADKSGALGTVLGGLSGTLGVSLPDDLPAAVGHETAVAVLGQDGSPAFGVRTRTDDANRGLAALQRVLAQTVFSGSPDGVARAQQLVRRTTDGLAAGSDAATAGRLATDGALGRSDTFTQAVPDAGDAGSIAYVDLQRALALSGADLGQQTTRNTQHLKAIGMSASSSSGGNGSFRIRLTFR